MWGDFHPWGRDNRRSTHQSPRRLCRRAHLSNIWDEWAEIRHGKAIHQVFRTASFLYSVRSSPYFRSQIIFYLHSMPHYSALKWETERTRGSDGGWQWGRWGEGGGWREYSAASPVSLSEANISSFLKMDFCASSPQVDTWFHQAGNKQRVKELQVSHVYPAIAEKRQLRKTVFFHSIFKVISLFYSSSVLTCPERCTRSRS